MSPSSWFGAKKQRLREEQEAAARELAAQAARDQALDGLKAKIDRLVTKDSRYRFTTFDGLNWICPYTGRIINAPFDFEAVAKRHLLQARPFDGGAQPMSMLALRAIAWQHFLREHLQRDPRFGHFRQGRWLNPFTAEWVDDVPLGPNDSILPETLVRLASALNASERSQQRECADPELVAARLRSDDAQQSNPAAIIDQALPNDDEIVISADEEFCLDVDATAAPTTTPSAEWPATDPAISQPREEASSRAERYDSQRARSVQSRLLPDIPELPGLQFGIYYRPHDAVSGDFYDIQHLQDGRWLIALGDVSGHGVQAGLVVHSTVKSLRFICKSCTDLGQIVCRLNEELLEDLLGDQFVTAWFAVLDPEQMQIDCVWCGHHPMVAARPSNDSYLNVIGQRGAALGVLKPELFARTVTPMQLDLQEGDVLLQYTDGASEAMDADQVEYGDHRFFGSFVTALLGQPAIDAQALVDTLAEGVLAHGNQDIDDDLTMLAIAVAPPPETAGDPSEDAFIGSDELATDI